MLIYQVVDLAAPSFYYTQKNIDRNALPKKVGITSSFLHFTPAKVGNVLGEQIIKYHSNIILICSNMLLCYGYGPIQYAIYTFISSVASYAYSKTPKKGWVFIIPRHILPLVVRFKKSDQQIGSFQLFVRGFKDAVELLPLVGVV